MNSSRLRAVTRLIKTFVLALSVLALLPRAAHGQGVSRAQISQQSRSSAPRSAGNSGAVIVDGNPEVIGNPVNTANGTLSGTVASIDGTSLPSFQVTASSSAGTYTGTTAGGVSSSYSISVPAGTYTVTVSANSYTVSPASIVATVASGGTSSGNNFTLGPPAQNGNGTITGVVTVINNNGITPSFQVTAVSGSGATYTTTSAAGSGTYSLSVPAGTYTHTVQPTASFTITPAPRTVVVTAGATAGVYQWTASPVAAGTTYSIEGYVVLPQSACPGVSYSQNVTVTLTGNGVNQSSSASAAPLSSHYPGYSFSNLAPGTYTISVAATGTTSVGTLQVTITSQNISNANVSISPLVFNVCGSLTVNDGTAPPAATVYLVDLYGNQRTTTVSNGNYVFQGVAPGYYTASIPNPPDGSYSYSGAMQFQVVAADVTGLNFTSRRNFHNITGTVINTGGSPYLGAATFYLFSGKTQIQSAAVPFPGCPNQNCFKFSNLPNGTYLVQAGKPPAMQNITPTKVTVVVNNADTSAGTFTVGSAGVGGAVNGNMAYSGPTIASFAPLSATVTLTSRDYANTSASTTVTITSLLSRAPATYNIGSAPNVPLTQYNPGLPPGNYILSVSGNQLLFNPNNFPVTITSGVVGTLPQITASYQGINAKFQQNGGAPQIQIEQGNNAMLLKPSNLIPQRETKNTAEPAKSSSSNSSQNEAETNALKPEPDSGGTGATATLLAPNIHFVNGFGAPDPDNPGYTLPNPNVPQTDTTVNFSGVIYAPVDGWYQFRTATNGPVQLAVAIFPPDGPLVINAGSDISQLSYGSQYLQGGHEYGIALNYYYDNANTEVVDLAWEKPGDTSFTTIDFPYYSQLSTLGPLEDWLLYANNRFDNYTVADSGGIQSAANAGYTYMRTEGCAYPYPLPGTVPLYVFYNGSDNFSTATAAGIESAGSYQYEGIGGYIYPTPLTDGTSVPLETWYGLSDNFAAASSAGIAAAQQAGYVFIRTEGWVLPAGYCQQ